MPFRHSDFDFPGLLLAAKKVSAAAATDPAGETAHIVLTSREIAALAEYMALTVEEFVKELNGEVSALRGERETRQ